MIWTKKELLKTLERYEDDDTFAGALWTKEDVAYQMAEVTPEDGYAIDPDKLANFDPDAFWADYIDKLDESYENDISWQNDELFTAVLDHLKGDN